MPQILRSTQAPDTVVPVTPVLVRGTGDLAQVGRLVQRGGGLVLGVAGAADLGQVRKVQRAVDHVALAGKGVGQDTIAAGAVDVGAVLP